MKMLPPLTVVVGMFTGTAETDPISRVASARSHYDAATFEGDDRGGLAVRPGPERRDSFNP